MNIKKEAARFTNRMFDIVNAGATIYEVRQVIENELRNVYNSGKNDAKFMRKLQSKFES